MNDKQDVFDFEAFAKSLNKEDTEEIVYQKLAEAFGFSLDTLKAPLIEYIKEKHSELAEEIFYIAPKGDYGKMMNEVSAKAKFLLQETTKPEVWSLISLKPEKDMLRLVYACDIVNDGNQLKGDIYLSSNKKVKHAFVYSDE